MKKRILSLLITLGLCLSLCGCQYLDDMKTARAYMTEDGTIILADGMEYKLLPECEEFWPDFHGAEDIYIVTDPELPLLLTSIGATYGSKSADGRFLQIYDLGGYYCQADIYASMCERIHHGFTPAVYCYQYYDIENHRDALYELTLEQAAALEWVYYEQELEELPTGATMVYDVRVDLYLCSSDHLFRQDTIDIGIVDGKYYLIPSYASIYPVPEELNQIFNEIMAKELQR